MCSFISCQWNNIVNLMASAGNIQHGPERVRIMVVFYVSLLRSKYLHSHPNLVRIILESKKAFSPAGKAQLKVEWSG